MSELLAGDRVSTGLWFTSLVRLRRDRRAIASLIALVALLLFAWLAPYLSTYAFDAVDWQYFPGAPSIRHGHWFGTDAYGRDLFVRLALGLRISLLVGLCATLVSVVIGTSWGAVAGYIGGRTDMLMMRFVDVLYSLPFIFFVIVLTVVFGSNLLLMFLAIGAVGWLTMARIVRAQTMALRHKEFIAAAIVAGVSTSAIIRRHVVPNVLGPVIVYATLSVPQIILFESFLSFLGLGVPEPLTSLGKLVSEGAAEMETSPWMLMFPAGALSALLVSLNFLGDAVRDALDPRTHE